MSKITEWRDFKKGDITNKGFKIERVQIKVETQYYIGNLVDKISEEHTLLRGIDKILLKGGDGKPIALYPLSDQDIEDVVIYLKSIKDTDITVLYISMGDNYDGFVDTDRLEEIAIAIKAATKFKIRYFLRD